MAHVVGVPKRDPCRKCQLPVFLAERLMVGKKVFHRTCLKCARCGNQLTPGSFYETETDEQYCCETCPDEEVNQNSADNTPLDSEVSATDLELRNVSRSESNTIKLSRNSIKDRLAFFESHRVNPEDTKPFTESNTKLLQKSLSDEEKTKSLKKSENLSGAMDIYYKGNPALSNFLNNSIDSEEDTSEPSLENSKMETSDSEDDTHDLTNVTQIPELPRTLPPLKEQDVENIDEKKHFLVSTQLVLDSPASINSSDNAEEEQSTQRESAKQNQTHELNFKVSSIDSPNNNDGDKISPPLSRINSTVSMQLDPNIPEGNSEKKQNNDNYLTTKDKSTDDLTNILTNETPPQPLLDVTKNVDSDNRLITQPEENQIIIDELTDQNALELRTSINKENTHNYSPKLEINKKLEQHIAENYHPQQVITKENELNESEKPENDVISENKLESSLGNPKDSSLETHENPTTSSNNFKTEAESLDNNLKDDNVALEIKTKENEKLECNLIKKEEHLNEANLKDIPTPQKTNSRTLEEYPDDLNPFKSDEENEVDSENNKEKVDMKESFTKPTKQENFNPFDSSDDEIELEKTPKSITTNKTPKIPPPRPPPPRLSKNPFGSEDEDETSVQNFTRRSSLTGSQSRKTPIPTPRSNTSQSQNPTPEPTPRISTKANTTTNSSTSTTPNNSTLPILQNSSEFYGSANSLYSNNATPYNLQRNSDLRLSNNSLNLSAGGTLRSRKSRRAPLPPAPVKELFPSSETINSSSKTSTPSSSTVGTPKSSRKKRPAPAPPKPARLEASQVPKIHVDTDSNQPKNLNNYPLQSELDSKLSDEEKALLEGKTLQSLHSVESLSLSPSARRSSKRLITLDKELLEEHGTSQNRTENTSQSDDLKHQNQSKSLKEHEDEPSVVYRRVLIPPNLETPTHEHNPLMKELNKSNLPGERQMEKLKDNKEANNRNRQSQVSVSSSITDDIDPLLNKSAHGKWKRRKGPAPALPLPPRKVLQMLPLQEIKHELEIIEVQQQGLEKQGVILEKMIRDRCEGENGEPLNSNGFPAESDEFASGSSNSENSKEVENLILQLFELVNEKNELFRRQAELMYLRRQHRLEQEQADLEYEIRVLMAQPERNKTDSDKAREEALIERLLEVVQLRNEVVECLEMDRLREAEEDQSIKQRLESHIAKREDDFYGKKTLTKLSKKERKKQKEAKKLFKNKKLDADKDADESELNVEKLKSKKKKKLLIF